MSFEQKIVAPSAKRTRLWVVGAFAFALLAQSWVFWQFLSESLTAIGFRGELDYGEGIVWEQMRLMVAGRGYAAIDGMPAIVFHYPPLFHALTAALSGATGFDQLAVGRSVSFASTLLIGLFAGVIAATTVRADAPRRTAIICGLVATLATFCFSPIPYWAPLMRVDMLSIALTFAGLLAAMAAISRPVMVLASATLFVAAVYTKQTSIIAPAAVFLTFLLVRPRLAWQLLAVCVVLGLIVLGALVLATDGGFARHIFLYNANRFEFMRLLSIPFALTAHSMFAAAILFGVMARVRATLTHYRGLGSLAAMRERLQASPGDTRFLMLLVYAALASVMTLTIAKSGSNANYLIEWMAVLAILLGVVARDAADAAFGKLPAPTTRLFAHPSFVPLLVGLQALIYFPLADYSEQRAPSRVAELQTLEAMVRAAPRPVISDDMVLLLRAGVPVQWEPAIFAELASTGTWDERPFVDRVKKGQFAFFITARQRGDRLFDSRYNRAVADAMDAAYPVKRKAAGYTLHLPADGAR